jgi:hypothetical protein
MLQVRTHYTLCKRAYDDAVPLATLISMLRKQWIQCQTEYRQVKSTFMSNFATLCELRQNFASFEDDDDKTLLAEIDDFIEHVKTSHLYTFGDGRKNPTESASDYLISTSNYMNGPSEYYMEQEFDFSRPLGPKPVSVVAQNEETPSVELTPQKRSGKYGKEPKFFLKLRKLSSKQKQDFINRLSRRRVEK